MPTMNNCRVCMGLGLITVARKLEKCWTCKGTGQIEELTELEKVLLAALKGAVKHFEYTQAFSGRSTSRDEMMGVLKKWRETAPASSGIGVGASYGSDATFHYAMWRDLILSAEGVKRPREPHYTKADCPTGCGSWDCKFCGEHSKEG